MSPPELTRRDFLKALPIGAAAAGACGRSPYRAAGLTRAATSPVALLPATDYAADLSDVITRGLQMLGVELRGTRVLLKPNMVEYESDKAINTAPTVVAGAAIACLRAGASAVMVGEGPGHRRDIEYLLGGTGMNDVLSDLRLSFVDLNHDDVRLVPLASNHTGLGSLWLPAAVLDADLVISMPKLKTHHYMGMTASMKNLFGVVPGAVYGWPKNVLHFRGIEKSIVDINATVRPGLTIVDGIIGMEGDGPIMGRPRAVGFLAMGTDLCAVDATCARVIGLDPAKVPYLALGREFLGNIDESRIEQRGEKISRYRTQFDLVEPIRQMRLS